MRRSLGQIALTTAILLQARAAVAVDPLPEFFGVYALVDGQLSEIKPLSRTCYLPGYSSGVAGSDLIQCLSLTRLPHGELQFIVFAQNAASHMKIPARRIARVASEETLDFYRKHVTERRALEGRWFSTDRGEALRVAPVPSNPQLMIRAVPERTLRPGIWALDLDGLLYPFSIGENPEQSADCVVRVVALEGVEYRECQAGAGLSESGARKPGAPSVCLTQSSAVLHPSSPSLNVVKVMKRPDTLSPQLASAPSGTVVKTLGAFQNSFCKVEVEQGIGWVSALEIKQAEGQSP